MQVIFFPELGQSHKIVRQLFLFALMEAAERLQIPMVPTQLTHNFSMDQGRGVLERTPAELVDLIPKGTKGDTEEEYRSTGTRHDTKDDKPATSLSWFAKTTEHPKPQL